MAGRLLPFHDDEAWEAAVAQQKQRLLADREAEAEEQRRAEAAQREAQPEAAQQEAAQWQARLLAVQEQEEREAAEEAALRMQEAAAKCLLFSLTKKVDL